MITSFAASEAAAGSDLLALETTATRTDGGYVLRGRKEYSTNLRDAQYVIVVAAVHDIVDFIHIGGIEIGEYRGRDGKPVDGRHIVELILTAGDIVAAYQVIVPRAAQEDVVARNIAATTAFYTTDPSAS